MELKINIGDNLNHEELLYMLDYVKILSDVGGISVNRETVLDIEDELFTLELGKGQVNLSDEQIADVANIHKIVDINRNFNILKMRENLSSDYKLLSVKNLREISIDFIDKNPEYFDFKKVSSLNLSEEFMDRHFDKLDKKIISLYDNLSINFIIRHLNELDPYNLSYSYINGLEELVRMVFEELDTVRYLPFINKIQEIKIDHFIEMLKPYESQIRDIKIDNVIHE